MDISGHRKIFQFLFTWKNISNYYTIQTCMDQNLSLVSCIIHTQTRTLDNSISVELITIF